jgi:hypothetical protein|tara:strand:- start:2261 stop:3013 length:753 start_codon:yes stop_codon:yes gene_type:complete
MVVAEILTGIALVQKSVAFIKSNIDTVNDISGIAKQIDGFFLGEKQMNKSKGKGMSIAEQFGSVENSANDFINMKLLEEQRNELKQLVNLRFGPTTWDEIIAERANRISEAKEASRLKRVEKRQQQKEIIDTLQTMGIIFCVIAVLGICVVLAFKSYADSYKYKPKDYTRQQKINQGIIQPPKLTLCRLKKQKTYKDKVACIYQGANKTFELSFQDMSIGCVRKFRCILNPNGKEPSIDSVMESLRSIAK